MTRPAAADAAAAAWRVTRTAAAGATAESVAAAAKAGTVRGRGSGVRGRRGGRRVTVAAAAAVAFCRAGETRTFHQQHRCQQANQSFDRVSHHRNFPGIMPAFWQESHYFFKCNLYSPAPPSSTPVICSSRWARAPVSWIIPGCDFGIPYTRVSMLGWAHVRSRNCGKPGCFSG